MRILYLGINYWPEETGIAPVNTWRCEYLAARGHKVTMCTGMPYYPEWKVAEEYRGRRWCREDRNGVTILRSPLYVPGHVTSVRRILHEASFVASSMLRALASGRPELLVVASPPLGLALTARILSRVWKIPYVYDVLDLQPDAAAELGMLRDGVLLRFLRSVEKMAYRHASVVTTITHGMRQRIIDKGIAPAKVVELPLRADPALFDIRKTSDGARFRKRHALEGKFLVIHSGNMGVKQGLDILLRAAEQTTIPEMVFVLAGDGAVRASLMRKADQMGLKNLRFVPIQPRAEFFDMLAATDVALVAQLASVSDIVFPSKTVTLMAAGCPLVASVDAKSEVARAVLNSKAGVVIAPEDASVLASTLQSLFHDRAALQRHSQNGIAYARSHWAPSAVGSLFEQALQNAMKVSAKKSRRVAPAKSRY